MTTATDEKREQAASDFEKRATAPVDPVKSYEERIAAIKAQAKEQVKQVKAEAKQKQKAYIAEQGEKVIDEAITEAIAKIEAETGLVVRYVYVSKRFPAEGGPVSKVKVDARRERKSPTVQEPSAEKKTASARK